MLSREQLGIFHAHQARQWERPRSWSSGSSLRSPTACWSRSQFTVIHCLATGLRAPPRRHLVRKNSGGGRPRFILPGPRAGQQGEEWR